jgi:hypothetical protein
MSYTNGLDKPDLYFNTVLYTGNGSTQSITGVNFQPDFVWLKDRSVGTSVASHHLFNSIVGAGKFQISNNSDPEGVEATTLTSFDSDGFSVSTDTSTNNSGSNLVSWNWLASNTTASNTDGSITSTVSANTTSGFSIVTYTGNGTSGATIGHGLGAVPKFIVFKNRSQPRGWAVHHASLGTLKYLALNETIAAENNIGMLNDTAPTSTLITLGSTDRVNENTYNHVAYCFAEKKGFSKFGSYTGNGSTDGTFVYTGFKPAFLITKMYNTSGGSWGIVDGTRNEFNVVNKWNFADSSGAEFSAVNVCDFLSNGFKFRAVDTSSNSSGNSYIYMAFAENPFVTSTGIPTCAR